MPSNLYPNYKNKPAQNLCKRLAAQHPATMKVADGTSVELVSTV